MYSTLPLDDGGTKNFNLSVGPRKTILRWICSSRNIRLGAREKCLIYTRSELNVSTEVHHAHCYLDNFNGIYKDLHTHSHSYKIDLAT